jgi:hypothetical protein
VLKAVIAVPRSGANAFQTAHDHAEDERNRSDRLEHRVPHSVSFLHARAATASKANHATC